jgi:hypothetical protein
MTFKEKIIQVYLKQSESESHPSLKLRLVMRERALSSLFPNKIGYMEYLNTENTLPIYFLSHSSSQNHMMDVSS